MSRKKTRAKLKFVHWPQQHYLSCLAQIMVIFLEVEHDTCSLKHGSEHAGLGYLHCLRDFAACSYSLLLAWNNCRNALANPPKNDSGRKVYVMAKHVNGMGNFKWPVGLRKPSNILQLKYNKSFLWKATFQGQPVYFILKAPFNEYQLFSCSDVMKHSTVFMQCTGIFTWMHTYSHCVWTVWNLHVQFFF